jgi:hypothetical protein
MYKHLRKILKSQSPKEPMFDSFSTIFHTFQKPHILMSAENPQHHAELKMNHDDVLKMLRNKGYDVEDVQGKYGKPEKSLMIKNPPQHAYKHFHELARKLGQDSLIISNGYDHEMHYTNGEKAGKHNKGQGTEIYRKQPDDFYTTDEKGKHFQHNLDLNTLHTDSKFLKPYSKKMIKSEISNTFHMCKNEKKQHPLDYQNSGIKLIHYSPKEGMSEITPTTAGANVDRTREKPENKMSFYYLESAKPEAIVTSGAKSKYITSLGNKKLYDVGTDPENIWADLKRKSENRQTNPGTVTRDEHHAAIKQKGYHGIYNSSLDPETMGKVVGMFYNLPVEEEHKIHPNDFNEASSANHHITDKQRNVAGNFASERGEHNGDYLMGLKQAFEKEDGN